MTSVRESINMMNNVFGTRFDKTNVVALWPERKLKLFTAAELEKLRGHAVTELDIAGSQHEYKVMLTRLISRIDYVKKEKASEGYRESNRDSNTDIP